MSDVFWINDSTTMLMGLIKPSRERPRQHHLRAFRVKLRELTKKLPSSLPRCPQNDFESSKNVMANPMDYRRHSTFDAL